MSESTPKFILNIPTNVFIMPHIQAMGAFCTGHETCITDLGEDATWLGTSPKECEGIVEDFVDEHFTPLQEIAYVQLNKHIETPFIPTRDLKKCSDGYGTLLSTDLPISEQRGLRNKNIERFFAKRIKIIKRVRQPNWKLNVKFQHNLKTQLQKQDFLGYPAFTGLGIILRDRPSDYAEDTIISRARMYAIENEFEIGEWKLKPFDSIYLSSLV